MKNTNSNIVTKVRAHKQTKWEAKQNQLDRKNNRSVTVRDVVSHRTYSFRPSEVNITKTRMAHPGAHPGALGRLVFNITKNRVTTCGNLIIHDWATDTIRRLPHKKPVLTVSQSVWKKFARGHRSEW